MKCQNCNSELLEGAKFCTTCGTPVAVQPAGGVCGTNQGGGTIENCHNTGSINVTCSNSDIGIGGIVGKTSNGTVKTCENTGNVTVDHYCTGTGGIVGYAVGGSKVSNCRNSGSIDGNKSKTGGIVGENYGAIFRCYNTGAVTGAVSPATVPQAASQEEMLVKTAAPAAPLRTATT